MEEFWTEFVPTKRVEANHTIILHLLPCQASSSTNPTEVCLLATLTACTPGGIRKSTCSSTAVLGKHVKAPPPNLFSLSLSFPLFGLLQLAPTLGFGTAPARRAWDENNKATKIFHFTLYATFHLSVMSNGLTTSDSLGLQECKTM